MRTTISRLHCGPKKHKCRGGSRNWERGGAKVRVWQGVGQIRRRSRPGRMREGGTGGGHPSRPARGSGGAL